MQIALSKVYYRCIRLFTSLNMSDGRTYAVKMHHLQPRRWRRLQKTVSTISEERKELVLVFYTRGGITDVSIAPAS